MERDISKIAKTEYLLPELAKAISKLQVEIEKFTAEINKNAMYRLEWADKLFENAARQGLLQAIVVGIQQNHVPEEDRKTEWTIEDLRKIVEKSNFGYARATPRSTAACSNLMEQYKLDQFMAFCLNRGYIDDRFFFDAQWNDPEHAAYYKQKAAEAQAKREAEAAAEKERKKAEANAKRAATREAKKVARKS